MRTIETTVYKYAELTDAAKNKAREWFRDGQMENAWMKDFARWIYKQLEPDWDYQTSDEAIEESINANEYEFTADGKIA